MTNVLAFVVRPVSPLWAPRQGTNPAWRMAAESTVLQFPDLLSLTRAGIDWVRYTQRRTGTRP